VKYNTATTTPSFCSLASFLELLWVGLRRETFVIRAGFYMLADLLVVQPTIVKALK